MIITPNITPGQARDILDRDTPLASIEDDFIRLSAMKARDMGVRTGLTMDGRIVAVIVPVSDLDAVHYCEHAEPGGDL